ncbi:hypothetical protein ACLOJK_034239, partial [Asimina triloba]
HVMSIGSWLAHVMSVSCLELLARAGRVGRTVLCDATGDQNLARTSPSSAADLGRGTADGFDRGCGWSLMDGGCQLDLGVMGSARGRDADGWRVCRRWRRRRGATGSGCCCLLDACVELGSLARVWIWCGRCAGSMGRSVLVLLSSVEMSRRRRAAWPFGSCWSWGKWGTAAGEDGVPLYGTPAG